MLNFILSARLLCAEKTCKNLAYFTLLNIVHKGKVGDHEKLVGECTLGSILRDRIAEISLSFRKTSRITHFLSSLYHCHFIRSSHINFNIILRIID